MATNRQLSSTINIEGADVRPTSETRLRGRWLVVARIGWIIIALVALSIILVGLPVYFTFLHTACRSVTACSVNGSLASQDLSTLHRLGIPLDAYVVCMVALNAISLLVWTAAGWLIFWRKSYERMALLSALFLVAFSQDFGIGDVLTLVSPGWFVPVKLIRLIGDTLIFFFIMLFPDGRFVPRWTLWLAPLYIVVNTLSDVSPAGSPINSSILSGVIFLLLICIGLYAQIYRYRRVSTQTQRQQTRWVLFGIAVAILGYVVLFVPYLIFPTLSQPGSIADLYVGPGVIVVTLFIPVCIGIAILRSRLWDIDVIINKALVYGLLTAILAAIYIGLILGLQALLGSLFHESNAVVLVVSTLAIYALFRPLRRSIQAIIDRRFYRKKYDAARTLAAFNAVLRTEVDLNRLSEHLLDVVQETMQPAHVSLWLSPTGQRGKSQSAEEGGVL